MDIDEKYKERLKYLKRFLKEHGVYTIFFKNIKERRFDEYSVIRNNFNSSWEEMVKSGNYIDSVIDASFIWRNTPEGHGFWSGLNNTFRREYYEKRCKL